MDTVIKKWERILSLDSNNKDIFYSRDVIKEILSDIKSKSLSEQEEILQNFENYLDDNHYLSSTYKHSRIDEYLKTLKK